MNPAVLVAMYSLDKCDFTECYVGIAGSMTAGLLAFPLFLILLESMEWTALGGPEFSSKEQGFVNEFVATMGLCVPFLY